MTLLLSPFSFLLSPFSCLSSDGERGLEFPFHDLFSSGGLWARKLR